MTDNETTAPPTVQIIDEAELIERMSQLPPDQPVPDHHPAWAATSPYISRWMFAFVTALGQIEDVIRAEEAKVKAKSGVEYSYTYAGLASYFAACRPKLAEQGLAASQTVTNDDGTVTVWTTILHESGEWVTFLPLVFATSANPQDVGSAMTYGRRYSLMAALGMASEDDDAGRARDGAASRKREQQAAADAEPRYTPAQYELRRLWYDEIEATQAPFLADVRAAFILRWGRRIENMDDGTTVEAAPWVTTVGLAMPNGWDAVKAVIDRMAVTPEAPEDGPQAALSDDGPDVGHPPADTYQGEGVAAQEPIRAGEDSGS